MAHTVASKIMAPRITLAARIRVVPQYSGHKHYQSFSVYFHKADLGEKRACLILGRVDGCLIALGTDGTLKTDKGKSATTSQVLTNHRTVDRMLTVA